MYYLMYIIPCSVSSLYRQQLHPPASYQHLGREKERESVGERSEREREGEEKEDSPQGSTITPDLALPLPNIFLKLFSYKKTTKKSKDTLKIQIT